MAQFDDDSRVTGSVWIEPDSEGGFQVEHRTLRQPLAKGGDRSSGPGSA